MVMEYQHARNKVYLMNYHLIWCPKRRKKVLTGHIKTRLEQIITDVATEKNIKILALEIIPDHLHLFVSSHPNIPVHNLIRAFKGRSSNLLRKEFPELLKLPSLWTHSYFISTARNVSSETIQKYIEAQSKQ
ncbi:MAG: IS200/IS605 family transposase [Methanosarcinales archaeon]|uniref:IS200/IS605 family transposase n=1 Tax=Candidatus Ethanoperedens thermophilum TaxID=2766897 RepID=A0A848D530_9EURY|nr:IS200/IS605 family transposase [Candidatus Ethanoperedens thermophilum]